MQPNFSEKMKTNIVFTANTDTVTEGDVIDIQWNCSPAESVRLTIDNGFKSSTIDIENSGSKRFRLNRSKGKTKLTITAVNEGKEYSKTLKIKVKEMEVINAETVSDNQNSFFNNFRHNNGGKFSNWWRSTKMKLLYTWMALPPNKKIAYIILNFLMLLLIIAMIFPKFLMFGLILIIIYLLYVLMKK